MNKIIFKIYLSVRKISRFHDLNFFWHTKGKQKTVRIKDIKYCLNHPAWSTDKNHKKNLKPIDVVERRECSYEKYNDDWLRIIHANLNYPICVINWFCKYWIIDGYHRLCKAVYFKHNFIDIKVINIFKVLNVPVISWFIRKFY
ncbi:MAG: hypothetical protein M0Q13_12705 [Methanothrix sp.]|jgi:hypothetical protein|nr:hypothetical protein [Methanothrix sp.]